MRRKATGASSSPTPAPSELDSVPPFLSWATLYWIVAAALLVEVIAFTIITLIYR